MGLGRSQIREVTDDPIGILGSCGSGVESECFRGLPLLSEGAKKLFELFDIVGSMKGTTAFRFTEFCSHFHARLEQVSGSLLTG